MHVCVMCVCNITQTKLSNTIYMYVMHGVCAVCVCVMYVCACVRVCVCVCARWRIPKISPVNINTITLSVHGCKSSFCACLCVVCVRVCV